MFQTNEQDKSLETDLNEMETILTEKIMVTEVR